MVIVSKHKIIDSKQDITNNLSISTGIVAKPFLKWAGGKGQLLAKFQSLYPTELKENKIKSYFEPFLGSGAVFFDVIQKYKIESAFLYDINDELILTYKVIQKDATKLIDFLNRLQVSYSKLDKVQRHAFFYDQRAKYNLQRNKINYNKYSEKWFPRAAQLIFLNRTCFNGLYRVNSKGEFNSPVGDYKNPTICDEQNILAVNKVLEIAEIKKADFTELTNDIKDKSFVYFDPPYRPISKTSSFKAYSKQLFDDSEQIKLAELFKHLDTSGAKLMLSNSDPKNIDPNDNFFDDIYIDFNIQRISARRLINSNSAKRGTISEIIVTNYPMQENTNRKER